MNVYIFIKIAGIICILCSSVLYGATKVYAIRERESSLENCVYMLTAIKQQLIYTNDTPLEILMAIQDLGSIKDLDFVRNAASTIKEGDIFSQKWREGIRNSTLSLAPEDKQELAKLSDILGCYDIETQKKYIELLTENIKLVLEKLHITNDNQVKLTQTLSVLAGIFFSIIII